MNTSRNHPDDNTESDPSLNDDGEILFEPERGLYRKTKFHNRRTHARLSQESLVCDLGPILDLSIGGLRVLCKRCHEGPLTIRLSAFEFDMNLDGQVVWSKHIGFRRYEIGVQFLNVDDNTVKILSRISAIHRMRRAI